MSKSSLLWRHVSGFTQINEARRQAAQGAHWGGLKADPPSFFCVEITVGVTSFTGRVQPPQPPANFYAAFKVPVELAYRTTLIPVWFVQSWLATILPTCLNQFLQNFEEMFFNQTNHLSVLQGSRGTILSYRVDTSLVWPFVAGRYMPNVF